jgi:hypothetical protein
MVRLQSNGHWGTGLKLRRVFVTAGVGAATIASFLGVAPIGEQAVVRARHPTKGKKFFIT